ncbi:MAG: 4-hydroxythreonine-4-phosphate dehydrogenase PdxA [Pyramidobacter sp.]|nr:4-hydroxythreonine-4-phosphate dehydrogenase PdxA [Pyramidobacter sp.]
MKKPVILIPMGDPAGVGPEIIIKALADPVTANSAVCVVIGDKGVLEGAMQYPNMPKVPLNLIQDPNDASPEPGVLNLIDLHNIDPAWFRVGQVDGRCGKAAYAYIETAIRFANERHGDAVATPPINKVALSQGGVPFIGHTEIFGKLTGTPDPLTMFEVKGLRVFFLTRHVALRTACDQVTTDRIIDYGRRCSAALAQIGVTEGTMAVAGLNPHSGEHGLFGNEEDTQIVPAVEALKKEGYQIEGPISADSVFHLALIGRYNSVLSLYHDQGHIATKTYDFERTISLTLGMPILRTSVDHGTAMDIAGTGTVSAISMIEAVRLAVKYAPYFTQSR